jgi:hypothetical protein
MVTFEARKLCSTGRAGSGGGCFFILTNGSSWLNDATVCLASKNPKVLQTLFWAYLIT